MLDTNTASYAVSGRSPRVRQSLSEAKRSGQIVISVFTEAELRFGLVQRPGATKLTVAYEVFFSQIDILAADSEVAKAYARLRTGINAAGKSLDEMDMLIAAHALAVGATLVSHDKAFQQLAPWLNVVDWATDI